MQTFQILYDFCHPAVVPPVIKIAMFHTWYSYFGRVVQQVLPEAAFSFIEIDPESVTGGIPEIPADVGAVYLLPLFPEKSLSR